VGEHRVRLVPASVSGSTGERVHGALQQGLDEQQPVMQMLVRVGEPAGCRPRHAERFLQEA
jgi:hypothetical protein